MGSEAFVFHTYAISGVQCSLCLKKLKSLTQTVPGLKEVIVDMSQRKLKVSVDSDFCAKIFGTSIQNFGFEIRELQIDEKNDVRIKEERHALLARVGISGALAGNIMLLSYAVYLGAPAKFSGYFNIISGLLYLPILIYAALPFYRSSLAAMRNKSPSLDLPLTIAILCGSLLSYINLFRGSAVVYFDSLAALVFLILGSRFIVQRFQSKYLAPISIKDIFPDDNYLKIINGQNLEIEIEEIQAGDTIKLRENQVVPADCRLLSSEMTVDNSLMTGESDPTSIKQWSHIYAGARCISSHVTVEVLKNQENSRIRGILQQLDVSLNQDSSIVETTDKYAHYFTYGIFGSGLIFFLFYSFVNVNDAVNRVLALFVIACPCAIAITAPLVLRLSAKRSMKNNFLVKNPDVFEKLSRCKTMIFDKTGTLTFGQSKVVGWNPSPPSLSDAQVLFSLEKSSSHPVAKALLADFGLSNFAMVGVKDIKDIKEIEGLGIEGSYNNTIYSLKKTEKNNGDVGFYKNNRLVSTATIRSELRPEAEDELIKLENLGIESYILSGDNQEHTHRLAKMLHIPANRALFGVSPEEKNFFIQKLSASEDIVYIGDGLNDSLAMSNGRVGISMNQSVESTFSASDIHILKDGIEGLSQLFVQSDNTLKIVKLLLLVSLVYNTVFGILALSGFVTPLVAAILMPISSLTLLSLGVYLSKRLLR